MYAHTIWHVCVSTKYVQFHPACKKHRGGPAADRVEASISLQFMVTGFVLWQTWDQTLLMVIGLQGFETWLVQGHMIIYPARFFLDFFKRLSRPLSCCKRSCAASAWQWAGMGSGGEPASDQSLRCAALQSKEQA